MISQSRLRWIKPYYIILLINWQNFRIKSPAALFCADKVRKSYLPHCAAADTTLLNLGDVIVRVCDTGGLLTGFITAYKKGHLSEAGFNPFSTNANYVIFTHLKLCLATAIHSFKLVKIPPISFNVRTNIFAFLYDWTRISSQAPLFDINSNNVVKTAMVTLGVQRV